MHFGHFTKPQSPIADEGQPPQANALAYAISKSAPHFGHFTSLFVGNPSLVLLLFTPYKNFLQLKSVMHPNGGAECDLNIIAGVVIRWESCMARVWIQDMTWEEVKEMLEKTDVAIVPVGSTEQHGLHAPLGTDSMIAIKLAEEVAEKTGVVVAPPLWFGWSPHHMAYPGTITIRPEVMTEIVVDLCKSLIQHGFRKIVVINGHREANLPPLKEAAWRVREDTDAYVAIVDPFYIGDTVGRQIRTSEPGGIGHADELETSHMLYLYPNLMKMEKAVKNIPKPRKFHMFDPYVQTDRVFIPSTIEDFKKRTAPSGVSGDPTKASREKGEKYHKALINNLVEFIEQLKSA